MGCYAYCGVFYKETRKRLLVHDDHINPKRVEREGTAKLAYPGAKDERKGRITSAPDHGAPLRLTQQ